LALALDAYLHIGEGMTDRGLGLVHHDLNGLDQRTGQHPVGDAGGEGLDEVEWLALDERDDVTGNLGVVDRVGQVVAGAGSGEVDIEDHVHDERLPLAPLEVEHPVEAAGRNALQRDLVRHRRSTLTGPP
jgi:hypothetical protein